MSRFTDHLSVTFKVKFLKITVVSFYLKTETRCEVLFITDHYIYIFGNLFVDFSCFFYTADSTPHRRTIVKIVRYYSSVLLCGLACFDNRLACLFRKCRIYTTCMKPAHTECSEDIIKIEIFRCSLRYSCIGSVRASYGSSYTEASLCKINTVSAYSSDSISLLPEYKISIYSTLLDEVLHKSSYFIIRKCSDNSSSKAKALMKSADNIILSAAFPGSETSCCSDSSFTRIKSEHNLAETYRIIFTFLCRSYI